MPLGKKGEGEKSLEKIRKEQRARAARPPERPMASGGLGPAAGGEPPTVGGNPESPGGGAGGAFPSPAVREGPVLPPQATLPAAGVGWQCCHPREPVAPSGQVKRMPASGSACIAACPDKDRCPAGTAVRFVVSPRPHRTAGRGGGEAALAQKRRGGLSRSRGQLSRGRGSSAGARGSQPAAAGAGVGGRNCRTGGFEAPDAAVGAGRSGSRESRSAEECAELNTEKCVVFG